MPYNADLLQQYQQEQRQQQQQQQQQQYHHQYQRHHALYEEPPYTDIQLNAINRSQNNEQTQYTSLQVLVPQPTYHEQTINQAYYMNQQASGHHLSAPLTQHRLLQSSDQQVTAPYRQLSASQQPAIQVEVPSKPLTPNPLPAIDYQGILLALADEYLGAAYDRDMRVALAKGEACLNDYHKLVSTALGCMEAVLTKYRLPPVKEAHVRLRFAQTLMAETENDLEAETALSKGIDLCDRNKFLDLKYTMQVSLCRVLYRSSPKAAIKAIDGIIEDVIAYKHTAWEYAFRLLRACLSISMPSHQDFVTAIYHLQKTADLAQRRGDYAVFAFAAGIEALAHLQSPSPDSIDHAQRALATAQCAQLNQDASTVPQIQVLVQYVDLCCSLQQCHLEQVGQKLPVMQQIMDNIVNDKTWRDDGSVFLSLCTKSVQKTPPMGGDIVQIQDGRAVLAIAWLPKTELYAISYLLSAVASNSKNAQSDHRAELFLAEGSRLVRSESWASRTVTEPLTASSDRFTFCKLLECQFLLEKVLLLCARNEWDKARKALDEVFSLREEIPVKVTPEFDCLIHYANATIYQGTGDLTQALSIFQSHHLALPSNCSKTSHNNVRRDVALLAAMNTMLIIRSPEHPSHQLLPTIFSKVDPFCCSSTNKHLLAARSLIISILHPSTHHLVTTESLSSTLLVKKHLSTALNIAKTIGNNQITAITLSFMSAKFFKGVLGEQAEKSARAGQNMANKSGMKLWMSVSNCMLADTLERQGKMQEAEKVQRTALALAGQMPSAVQRFESTAKLADRGQGGTQQQQQVKSQPGYRNNDDDIDELA